MNNEERIAFEHSVREALFASSELKKIVPDGALSGRPVEIADTLLQYVSAKLDGLTGRNNAESVTHERVRLHSLAPKEADNLLQLADGMIKKALGRTIPTASAHLR